MKNLTITFLICLLLSLGIVAMKGCVDQVLNPPDKNRTSTVEEPDKKISVTGKGVHYERKTLSYKGV